jgi:hypothetical protein
MSEEMNDAVLWAIARGINLKLGHEAIAALVLSTVGDFLISRGLSIVDEHLNIVEVI